MAGKVKGLALLLLLSITYTVSEAQHLKNDKVHSYSNADLLGNQQVSNKPTINENNAKQDSAEFDYNQKAKRSAIQSAVVPGLGQIRNGQVWKAPIVWAGLGITTYFLINNHNNYQEFAEAYRLRTDDDPNTIDPFSQRINNDKPVYSDQALKKARSTFRRRRTLSAFSIFGVWSLNILDAYVFAHLQDFDISDNLSASVNPPNFGNIAGANTVMTGITLKISP